MTSVVICDKAGPARDALANRVSQVRPVHGVRSASNPAELIEMLYGTTVDAVLLGSSLDAGHPADMVRLVRGAQPWARVYATTLGTDPEAILEAVEAGAHGYVAADASVPELSALLAHTDRIAVISEAESDIPQQETVSLTDRERQVLEGMSRGRSNSQIGAELFLSEDTIKTHARRLFRKLEVNDRAHAVAEGFRRGLIA